MSIVALYLSWNREGMPMPLWGAAEEEVVEGCIILLSASYFHSMAVPLSNRRR